MLVFDQADAGGQDIVRDRHGTGDGLVAGLGLVAQMGDRAGNLDAALTGQLGGRAVRQNRAQMMDNAVVFDDGVVLIGSAAQARAVSVGGAAVAEQTGQDYGIAELAG